MIFRNTVKTGEHEKILRCAQDDTGQFEKQRVRNRGTSGYPFVPRMPAAVRRYMMFSKQS